MATVSYRGSDPRLGRRGYRTSLKVSSQNSFYDSGQLADVGGVCTITGKYHFDLGTTGAATWADFCNKTQSEIEDNLRNVFLPIATNVSTDTTGTIILDLETAGQGGVEGHFSHPNHLWKETDADKALIITAWKRRIAATRAVFPNARIGMYALPRAGNLGDEDILAGDGNWSDRIEALAQAGTAEGYNGVGGAYDGLNILVPICYQIWGPNDTAQRWGATRARVVQAMEGARLIKKSDGSSIPAMPFLSTCVFGSASNDDGVLLADLDTEDPIGDTWGTHLGVFEEYGVDECCIWNGINSIHARDGAGETTTKLADMVREAKVWIAPVSVGHRRAQFE